MTAHKTAKGIPKSIATEPNFEKHHLANHIREDLQSQFKSDGDQDRARTKN